MPYRDIQEPIVGDRQILKVNGSDTIINLPTYLGYMQDNFLMSSSLEQSPIYINGVAGETMTLPVMTTTNSIMISGASHYFQAVSFPTAGIIRKTFTGREKPGMITVTMQATFTNVAAQATVDPALGFMLEVKNRDGNWMVVPFHENVMWFTAPFTNTHSVGAMVSVGLMHYFTELRPMTDYRVTALAGTVSRTGALPTTGQWKIDAVGTNTLEFHAWMGG